MRAGLTCFETSTNNAHSQHLCPEQQPKAASPRDVAYSLAPFLFLQSLEASLGPSLSSSSEAVLFADQKSAKIPLHLDKLPITVVKLDTMKVFIGLRMSVTSQLLTCVLLNAT